MQNKKRRAKHNAVAKRVRRNVGRGGIGRRHSVQQTAKINPNVSLEDIRKNGVLQEAIKQFGQTKARKLKPREVRKQVVEGFQGVVPAYAGLALLDYIRQAGVLIDPNNKFTDDFIEETDRTMVRLAEDVEFLISALDAKVAVDKLFDVYISFYDNVVIMAMNYDVIVELIEANTNEFNALSSRITQRFKEKESKVNPIVYLVDMRLQVCDKKYGTKPDQEVIEGEEEEEINDTFPTTNTQPETVIEPQEGNV